MNDIKPGSLRYVYNFRDPMAKARCYLLAAALCSALSSAIVSNIFYTGFLIENGLNIVDVGVITFFPHIANIFCIFVPSILGKIKAKKATLLASIFLYNFLTVPLMTFLPKFISDQNTKIAIFCAILFIGNLLNTFYNNGFSSWHIAFVPSEVRAKHFSTQAIVMATVSGIALISGSVIMDKVAETGNQGLIIDVMRMVGFAFALLNIYFFAKIPEAPNTDVTKVKISNIFTLPVKCRRFLITVLVPVGLYNLILAIPTGLMNVHLLDDLKIPYLYISIIDCSYTVFLIALTPFWQKLIRRTSWLKVFTLGLSLAPITYIMYAFVTGDNFIWLMTLVRVIQHIYGAGVNVVASNTIYLNMPNTDRAYYMSFATLVSSVAVTVGTAIGTVYMKYCSDFTVTLFGTALKGFTTLLLLEAVLIAAFVVLMLVLLPKMEPDSKSRFLF